MTTRTIVVELTPVPTPDDPEPRPYKVWFPAVDWHAFFRAAPADSEKDGAVHELDSPGGMSMEQLVLDDISEWGTALAGGDMRTGNPPPRIVKA